MRDSFDDKVKRKKITYNKKDIELILFFNKILISAEFRY